MNKKKTQIMLATTAAILAAIAVIDKFANTFISDILPAIVLVATIITIVELIIAYKVIKKEYRED